MKLTIHSIEKTIFEGVVKKFTLPTASGEITVLDSHLPLISVVVPGKIYYTDGQNKDGELTLDSGILEVKPAERRGSPGGRPESEAVILAHSS